MPACGSQAEEQCRNCLVGGMHNVFCTQSLLNACQTCECWFPPLIRCSLAGQSSSMIRLEGAKVVHVFCPGMFCVSMFSNCCFAEALEDN